MKQYYVYILFNKRNGTLYCGVTNDLSRRLYEHKAKAKEGFTEKYSVNKLGYYEIFNDIKDAIVREKEIKSGSRRRKLDLINNFNPAWADLNDVIARG